ncbi:alpha/beta hydrolase family protein [Thalassotalea crassostreae]|uniref:alpha/beta hydrolase family protein n=1 Tax=Thalassotalea crassostreae TaxID=1763536 RepID=UPI0008386B7D|nr:S9 family peptidase [Thalassotalea crassostreae]
MILTFVVTFWSATSVAANVITADDLTNLEQVSQVQVSHDGDKFAFTRSVPREVYVEKDGLNWTQLFLLDDKGVERPYITGQVNIKNIQWSHNDEYIYFLAKMAEEKYSSLYRIAFLGGSEQKVISLKDRSISSYSLSNDGKTVAILAKPASDKSVKKLKELGFKAEVFEEDLVNQELYLVDLKITKKAINPEAAPINDYVSAVHFSPNNDTLLVKTQPSALIDDKYTLSQWHTFNIASKKITNSFSTEGKLGDASFSHDGQYVAMIGAEDKHDPSAGRLFIANTNDSKVNYWLENYPGHIADFAWSKSDNELYFIGNQGTQSMLGKLELSNPEIETVISLGQFIPSNISISNSGKTIALKANTEKHVNEVFMVRNNKATRLTNSNEWLADRRFGKQQTLSLKARDGVIIDGILIYPVDYKEGQTYPLIMTVHGGPESHDKDGWVTNYSRPGQLAAGQGYAVFYPNYRGSTGKGVDYSKLGQNDYAGKEFDDLIDFKNHLVDMGLVDESKVGITGGSYGGYASAWGATKLTEHFAASVMFVGISNQLSKFGTTDISSEMHNVHARSYPWDKWSWYLERSPIYWAGQSKTPLLIMHGKDDPRVHPAQSMELYRYFKVQNKPVRLVYYPGEGHGNKRMAAKYDYNLRLMRWMDNYLKQGNKTMPSHELDHKDKLELKDKDTAE